MFLKDHCINEKIDARKAIDSFDHKYIEEETLRRYNFGSKFITYLRIL